MHYTGAGYPALVLRIKRSFFDYFYFIRPYGQKEKNGRI